MSVLAAIQSASVRLNQNRPLQAFGVNAQYENEMAELANEAAIAIAKAADWRALTKPYTINGTDAAPFALPRDYDRMPLKMELYSTRSRRPLAKSPDADYWMKLQIVPVVGYPGYWIILNGAIQIMPTLNAGEQVKFYYVSKNIISGDKVAFTSDTDEFKLSERLLALAIVWRWRALKGLDYAEDMKNYNLALSEEAGRDKGSRLLAIGPARYPSDVSIAFPGSIPI